MTWAKWKDSIFCPWNTSTAKTGARSSAVSAGSPPTRRSKIARKLCAGLAAAHEKGVLHRDLKPANVMLDSRGQVLLTDFGLAALAEGIEAAEIRNGTPAYMAPEQLAGEEVTVRSDIYALGLVLYEIFTGKLRFESTTLARLIRAQRESNPVSPASLVRDLDPMVERVILRCLNSRSSLRPPSALAVAAALPGGDPLAAALAAGETPSPEMVAAAGEGEGLAPRISLALLIFTIAGGRRSLRSQLSQQRPGHAAAGVRAGGDGAEAARYRAEARRGRASRRRGLGLQLGQRHVRLVPRP
jgi:serine/threonine-protein kinase